MEAPPFAPREHHVTHGYGGQTESSPWEEEPKSTVIVYWHGPAGLVGMVAVVQISCDAEDPW